MNDIRYPLGHVQIGSESFPVDSIQLAEGGLVVSFTVKGPVTLEGPMTIYGADGQGCWQSRPLKPMVADMASRWFCRYRLRIAEITDGESGILDWEYLS